jgi:hypothetical protein
MTWRPVLPSYHDEGESFLQRLRFPRNGHGAENLRKQASMSTIQDRSERSHDKQFKKQGVQLVLTSAPPLSQMESAIGKIKGRSPGPDRPCPSRGGAPATLHRNRMLVQTRMRRHSAGIPISSPFERVHEKPTTTRWPLPTLLVILPYSFPVWQKFSCNLTLMLYS